MSGIETLAWDPLFVMRLNVAYDRAQQVGGPGKLGIFPVQGGTFEGERLRGTVLPDGADWVGWREDGAMEIDVRTCLLTDDGAMIAMRYTGIANVVAADGAERLKRREILAYEDMYVHTTPRFETGDARYDWLNRTIAVTNGIRTPEGPVYHVFAIR